MASFSRKCAAAIMLLIVAFSPADAKTFNLDIRVGGNSFVPSAIPLETILDRYFEWRGGAAYAHLQSFHAKSSTNAGGAPASAEIWMDRKGRWRQDRVNTAGIAHRFAASSDSSWVSNAIGQSENDPGSLTFARRLAAIEFGDALRLGHGTQITLLGLSKGQFLGADFGEGDDLKDWAWVQVSFGDSDRFVVIIDPETGALAAYLINVQEQAHLYLFGNWRIVDGVRMPFWRVSHGDMSEDEDFAISNIDLNENFPESVFVRPPPSHAISFEGKEKETGWIDFTLEQGLIKIPVNVGGREVYAILDNGVSYSLLSNSLASSIGARVLGGESLIPSANSHFSKTKSINGVSIRIGNLLLKDIFAYSSDLSSVSATLGFPITLVLGDEVFFELVVDIDFQTMKLKFSESPRYLAPLAKYAMPLLRKGLHPAVGLSIEDRSVADFMLDLGLAAPLVLFPQYVQSEPELAGRSWSSDFAVGADGNLEERKIITLRNMTFGQTHLKNVPAAISQTSKGRFPANLEGELGVGIFVKSRIIFDYSRDKFYQIPFDEGRNRTFSKEHLGAFIHYEGGRWVVTAVPPNGPAARAGLNVGDVIVEIDGRPIDFELVKGAREGQVGKVVRLTLSGGDVKNITLDEYY